MSININGVISNIAIQTNVYTPLIEAIVNSIQAIEELGAENGQITVTLKRSNQSTIDNLSEVHSVIVEDNGIGFTETNRDSFDELFSELKKTKYGCKGFGRFMFQKYFQSIRVESNFKEGGKFKLRSFNFGRAKKIIEDEEIDDSNSEVYHTKITMEGLKTGSLEKQIDTIARKLLEKLLVYFIREDYVCPTIILQDETESIILNAYLNSDNQQAISLVGKQSFNLQTEEVNEKFDVKVFKIFFPNNQTSRIGLAADCREVTSVALHSYIPEFEDDFYEEFQNKKQVVKKNYFIKTYVTGAYLDKNVSLERESFLFSSKSDLTFPFSKEQIEERAAEITQSFFGEEVTTRKEKKKQVIHKYVEETAPWHKEYLNDIDISKVPYKLTEEIMDSTLHAVKFQQEKLVRAEAKKIINDPNAEITAAVAELINKLTKVEISDLAHYVALRKVTLGLFRKALEIQPDAKYSSENAVHNIIFPTKTDSDSIPYQRHNLWILDEKLSFAQFLSSDKPLNGGKSERPDILVFDKKIAFRGENISSNPITIFEFKKPQRDDFVNPSSDEDPVQQIVRYVNSIRDGKYKTPTGRDIAIAPNTLFYGFVICDLNSKVKNWLLREKNFKEMPDGKGWFTWYDNNNLYIEVLGWDKILEDSEMRNKIFFHKLGIE